jgi:hypothetical protein
VNTINDINHRSWHPVVFPTGRNSQERGAASGVAFDNIRPPFDTVANIGKQTMHCSDCHGQETSWTDGTGPLLSTTQGPHGAASPFLLKGTWGTSATLGNLVGTNILCGNCHLGTSSTQSGFNGNHDCGGNMSGAYCMRCHIAIPHGWKNKAFLVNKRCVGTEAGEATNCVNRENWTTGMTKGPYYWNATLSFNIWRRSRDAGYNQEISQCNDAGQNMKNCPKP